MHRIVGRIELLRARRFPELTKHVGDCRDLDRRLIDIFRKREIRPQIRQPSRAPSSESCAMSLSPRPLMQMRTTSSGDHALLSRPRDRVRRLERGDDSLEAAEHLETLEALRHR